MADMRLLACIHSPHPGLRDRAWLELRRVVEGIALRHQDRTTREEAARWLTRTHLRSLSTPLACTDLPPSPGVEGDLLPPPGHL